ncbi:histidinol dehydrogenase [Miltoncostaea marina]|uniref:histidinol dehydrogenase n=1 Tax=Miltoncostaea marina TaxID=2843215 RepID=UPI001C3D69D9|nr:histidinol dehydrogenase [Miltoncostaea marina]
MSEPRRARLRAGGVQAIAHTLRPEVDVAGLAAGVAETLEAVRARGDDALVEGARRFDCAEFTHDRLRVPAAAIERAMDAIDEGLRAAIVAAASQVRIVAEALLPDDRHVTLPFGQRVQVRSIPVDAAGCYAPGGRAAYPSSLIMGVVPAQVAGVERIVAVSPPGPDGRPSPVVLATAGLLGVEEVYAASGAAAVGALAYGTATIAPVAVIVGPGSPWVQEAKRQVVGVVGIDGVAGPSEVLIIADRSADPRALALDLLAQAEHGPDSPAVLASDDPSVVSAVEAHLRELPGAPGPITLVECASMPLAVELAEAFAPEHLEIATAEPEAIAERITSSGAVFVGPNCATAFGDYIAGSNHVLPTGGAARHASALGPTTFLRRMSVVEMTDEAVEALTPHLAALADAEGFTLHRMSAEARRRTP